MSESRRISKSSFSRVERRSLVTRDGHMRSFVACNGRAAISLTRNPEFTRPPLRSAQMPKPKWRSPDANVRKRSSRDPHLGKKEWQCVTLWCMRAGETRADIVFPDIPHWQRCLTTDSVFDGDVDRSFVRRDVLVPIRRRPLFSVFLFEKKRNRFGSHLPSETLVNLSHQQRAPAADSRDPVVQKDPVDRFGSSLQYPMTHPLSDPVRFANTRFRATIKKVTGLFESRHPKYKSII